MTRPKIDIRRIAELARLRLPEAEERQFAPQIFEIVGYVAILDELRLDGIAETAQVTGLENVFRSDEITPSPATPEELLAAVADRKGTSVRVSRILGGGEEI